MRIVDVKSEVFYGEVQLTAVYEDGKEEFLFGYFPDEYTFSKEELIGKTQLEAYELKAKKDLAYLRS